MKIGLQTWGSEGDIRPFRILARHLAGRGHDVTVVVTPLSAAHPHTRDDSYRTVTAGGAGPAGVDSADLRARVEDHRTGFTRMNVVLEEILWSHFAEMDAAARELAAHNDVVVRHSLAFPAALAARDAHVPSVLVALAPAPRVGQVPRSGPGGSVLNHFLRHGLLMAAGVELMVGLRKYRSATGRKPSMRGQDLLVGGDRVVIAASPSLTEKPGADAGRAEVIGQIDDSSDPAALDADVARFLAAGAPPVLVSPGHLATMEGTEDAFVRWVIDAARRAGVRMILQVPAHLVSGELGADVLRVDFVPHAAVLPRCAAVLHHAGAGTSHAAVRAGCPAVVVPHAFDQFYWADRLTQLGVAVSVSAEDKDPKLLAETIRSVAADAEMTRRTVALGAAVARDRGTEAATAIIESFGPR